MVFGGDLFWNRVVVKRTQSLRQHFYYVCSVCGCPEAGVSAVERCGKTAVLGAENRGYSVGNRRICGNLDAFGQYIMDYGRNGASDFGVAAWMGSSASDENLEELEEND